MKPKYPETPRRKKIRIELNKSDLPAYKISARRMLPKMPPMTKAELRQMLTAAVQNTKEVS